jgi:hypothetical protein
MSERSRGEERPREQLVRRPERPDHDPTLALFVSARECMRQWSARATVARLLSLGFVIAAFAVWPYLPALARPFAPPFGATLGVLLGRPIDRRLRRRS